MKLLKITTVSICAFLYGVIIGEIGEALGAPYIICFLFVIITSLCGGYYMYDWLMKD